ncbi:rna-directed dna polymerase from mobile element jockey- hypothetical protein [Limosa lapponica baueri]|uniref:Glycerol kinase n=1 Tax=Limosa lapponica baueri TaxID=1758121 RepID=A0A2I0UA25_LIMLA|nr:rna-directed dna polymerase from mobile element jockey- hypothetical protein [Limosa lapponica baueri]
MRDFNHPLICWEGYTARHVQSRRFLQCIDDNFLTQVMEDPTRRGVLLDLGLTNKGGLVEDIKVGGSLGCSDREKTEFRIMGSMQQVGLQPRTSGGLTLTSSRNCLEKSHGLGLWKVGGAQESWLIFKYRFLQAQDRCIPKSKKSGKGSRRLVWLSRELLKKLKWMKEVYSTWKKGLTTWEEYKKAVRVFRDEKREAKTSLELNLSRDIKVNRKGFVTYIRGKRKTREIVGLLLNERGAMLRQDAEKVELLNVFFASVFIAQASPKESHTLEVTEKVRTKEDFPLVEEDQVRGQLCKLDIPKSVGPDGMHP